MASMTAPSASGITKTQKICKLFSICMSLIIFFYLAWALFVTVASFLSLAGFDNFKAGLATISSTLCFVIYSAIIVFLLITIRLIFSEAGQGLTPFTMRQVKRLRLISLLLVLLALVEIVIANFVPDLYFNRMAPAPELIGENSSFSIDLTPLIGAAVIYAFSCVFKYGVLLQEDSDEII